MSRAWMDSASCAEVDPDIFFADGSNFINTKLAKKVCEGCRVIDMCLEYALVNKIDFGVWGGCTDKERKSLLRRRRVNDRNILRKGA